MNVIDSASNKESGNLKHDKTKILILGGGFAGTNVLRDVQKRFRDDASVEISMVSHDNFLFTPMLPEVSSGMLHPSDICTPVRTFCSTSKFYHAKILSANLKDRTVRIMRIFDNKVMTISYDYLVLAAGSIDNFFGNENLENHSFTIKSLEDAIGIRNHVISMLESADQEPDDALQDTLVNFVIVGGGFAGVEIATELNHFIQDAVKKYYTNIKKQNIRIILISSRDGVLSEVGPHLSQYAFDFLQKSGITILANTKAVDAGDDFVLLDDNTVIPCTTLIWAGGVKVHPVVSSIGCMHDKRSGRLLVNEFMELHDNPGVFALGDCASPVDQKTGKAFPSTAQVAIRQAKTVSHNLCCKIRRNPSAMKRFGYKNKGFMATIGKRTGVALLFGRPVRGTLAWALWRLFYWSNLPTNEKRIRVAFDWMLDSVFRADIMTVGVIRKKTVTKLENPMHSVLELKQEDSISV